MGSRRSLESRNRAFAKPMYRPFPPTNPDAAVGTRFGSNRSVKVLTHDAAVGAPRRPVDNGLESMVRRIAPVCGSIWWIFRSRYWPTQSLPSAQARSADRGSILQARAYVRDGEAK